MSELKQLCQCHYKIILLGEPGVGMTSFALRVKYGMFMPTNCRDNVRDAAVIMFKMKVDGDEVTVCTMLWAIVCSVLFSVWCME